MTHIKRIIATLTLMVSLIMPAFASAHSVSADDAIFSTPVSVKGHFMFVTKISRRSLLKAVAERERDQMIKQVLVRATI